MSDPPGTIGPYQVLKRLGAGGMGEVFLAYDQRLDRQVAIKRLRPDKGAGADRQERFRREARLAAKLNHPAIVHIYDVLTEEDVNFIVMEHVEGTNLRRLLDDGPLEIEEAVAIGRDVAEGLAEAHRLGIVHRDLKSENVLVTPSGRAKIADFGIAKRLLRGENDESLTGTGNVIGTYRTMSPEQARGEEVDHRSDLFSLGVLLYEALTGRSPFEAENELAMLHRIVHDRQTPVREVNPEVPEELSYLIDHLLEKDPYLRPRSAGEVAKALRDVSLPAQDTGTATEVVAWPPVKPTPDGPAAKGLTAAIFGPRGRSQTLIWIGLLVIAGLVSASYLTLRAHPKAPVYVAVLPPEAHGNIDSSEIALLASAVRVASVQSLTSLKGLSVKEVEESQHSYNSPAEAARVLAADEVIRSRLDCRPEACQISVSRIHGKDGSLLDSQSFDVPTDDLYVVANAVMNQVRRRYPDHPPFEKAPVLEANGRDFREFLRLRRLFAAREDSSLDSVLAGLETLRNHSPSFYEAYLLEADVLRYRFYSSRDPNDIDRALSLIQEARDMAPGSPQPLLVLIDVAAAANRLAVMERALSELEDLIPGDVQVLDGQARLLSAKGQQREAIAVLRKAVQRHPAVKRLFTLAQMEFQQGELAEARQHTEQLLQRAPGHFDGLSMLAGIELFSGDAEKAADLYARLVRRTPGLAELSNLGFCYFVLGRYAEAAKVYEQLVRQEPKNPSFKLNLADAYQLTGRTEEAGELYSEVVNLMATDPSASTPQYLSIKAQALAHLGRSRQAAAAVQEALRLAPDDGLIAFEASLVYALLGEANSALVNVDHALKLGIQKGWFSLPWFASLKSHPDFQELLGQEGSTSPKPPSG